MSLQDEKTSSEKQYSTFDTLKMVSESVSDKLSYLTGLMYNDNEKKSPQKSPQESLQESFEIVHAASDRFEKICREMSEITRKVGAMNLELIEINRQEDYMKAEIEERIAADLRYLTKSCSPNHAQVCTYIWRVEDLPSLMRKSSIASDPFYSHPFGYKLCAVLYPNDYKDENNGFVSCYVQILKGPMDEILKWPFEYTANFYLLNQANGKDHITKSIQSDSAKKNVFGKPNGKVKNIAWGIKEFVSVNKLKPMYMVDDVVFIKVELNFEIECK